MRHPVRQRSTSSFYTVFTQEGRRAVWRLFTITSSGERRWRLDDCLAFTGPNDQSVRTELLGANIGKNNNNSSSGIGCGSASYEKSPLPSRQSRELPDGPVLEVASCVSWVSFTHWPDHGWCPQATRLPYVVNQLLLTGGMILAAVEQLAPNRNLWK